MFVQCCCHRSRKGKFKISVSDNLSILVTGMRASLIFSAAVHWLTADACCVGPEWTMGVVHVQWVYAL